MRTLPNARAAVKPRYAFYRTAKPYTENPDMGNILDTAEPCTESPAQLNTNQPKTDLSSTELSNPYPINSIAPQGQGWELDRWEPENVIVEVILDNIEYSYLVQDSHIDREQLDETSWT